jgi:hypothetical protein
MQYKNSAESEEQSSAQTQDASHYVSENGNDMNNGRSEDTPFKTLQKAVERAALGTIKTITVIGSVFGNFYLGNAGSAEILITGKPDAQAAEMALISGGIEIVNSKVRFAHIEIRNWNWTGLLVRNKATVTLGQDVLLTKCNAVDSGGGVVVSEHSTLNMSDNAIISNNTAKEWGGGVAVSENSTLNMSGNAAISNNTANAGGGVFLFENSTLNMSGNTVISNNTANAGGGGVVVSGNCMLNMSGNAAISGNISKSGGGGVYVFGDNCIKGGKITGNTVKYGCGGGILTDPGKCTIENVEVSKNKASLGAGVFINSGELTVPGGKITGNEAEFVGGGVYVKSGAVYNAHGVSVTGNKAGEGGDDVFRQ